MAEGAGGDDDAGDGIAGRPVGARPRLLLFFTNADHPHRDPACATLAWLARAEGSLFECYYDSAHTGIHFGGGHPGWYDSADLRGGTVVGGRHVEALFNLLAHFRCEAALLGPTMFEAVLRDAGVTVRSAAADLPALYADLFATSTQARPSEVLVVGDGGQPQGVTLTPYAYPEIMSRRSLAMADGDWEAAAVLAPGRVVDTLWVGAERLAAWAERGFQASPVAVAPPSASVAEQTAWMAERWRREGSGFLLGDPELVARWTPTAVREGWLALYGIPQSEVIGRMAGPISGRDLVYGRQHHDQDFFLLSKLGVGFQVIDPGSPPFPVVAKVAPTWPAAPTGDIGPTDATLEAWADEGRILVSLLFWTGMIRELQNLYPLADMLGTTGLWSGLVLTTESYRFMSGTPLSLVNVARDSGGLHPRVETLLTDTGSGVMVAADSPAERFAAVLSRSVADLAEALGGIDRVPRGWWAHMDAPMRPGRAPRITRFPDPPHWRVRYPPRNRELAEPPRPGDGGSPSLRALVRDSPVGRRFAPLRPYEAHSPGEPSPQVLEAVRAAHFGYAITKSRPGPEPRASVGAGGFTVFNHTAGRWDGWSPFHTINDLSDLAHAERALLKRGQPGWIVGALDTCLWAFTGPVWERGGDLYDICQWAAGGGGGKLVNVAPTTVARYASLLARSGRVGGFSPG